jgi:hypothetical protein
MFLKSNRFGTIHRVIDLYPEYDAMDGSRFTVVVLENEEGNSVGVADNIVKQNYTILKNTKELKIKSLLMDYKNYRNKYDSLEIAAKKSLEETGEHNFHDSFDNMGYWEDELFERAYYLEVELNSL